MGLTSHKEKEKVQVQEKVKEKEEGDARGRFSKPTIEDIRMQCIKIGLPESEADAFFHYYESNGWVIGRARTPMKKWTSALQTWKRNREERRFGQLPPSQQPLDYAP